MHADAATRPPGSRRANTCPERGNAARGVFAANAPIVAGVGAMDGATHGQPGNHRAGRMSVPGGAPAKKIFSLCAVFAWRGDLAAVANQATRPAITIGGGRRTPAGLGRREPFAAVGVGNVRKPPEAGARGFVNS